MKRGYQKALITGLWAFAAVAVFYCGSAFAYPLAGTQDQNQATETSLQVPSFNFNWASGIFNNLSAPFQMFVSGIISGIAPSKTSTSTSNISTNPVNKVITAAPGVSIGNINGYFRQWTTVSGALSGFNNLLSGIFGFRTTSFFSAITGVIVWVLILAKSIIDWLLSVIH